ncbi:sugar ABC transporter permease [Deinococcus deserti]|uniref:Putative sugar ABC transporter, permease component n=1 Tax=Deinococcus deserti (strain DSM 17065 / CIP 109153 / LMG 22923 / VCD115) TaxID=546414 RepID=C1D431_DEIDV|nr:sugar ABC transporter permease [Deinococcus deserti]ACO47912.1 putative sugar ABC transporter, permease component [Deinococcus deserti VCD115]
MTTSPLPGTAVRRAKRRPAAPILFVLPALLLTVIVIAFPLGYTLYQSMTNWVITSPNPPKFIGLANYAELLRDQRAMQSLVRTLLITVCSVSLQMVLGVAMALVMNKHFFGRGLFRTLALFPVVATPVAISLIFVTMMNPQTGVLNHFLTSLGLSAQQWIYAEKSVLPALILVDTWQWTPFVMLIALAGLATLPSEPYEAAKIDGATAWQTFWGITLPMLMPSLFVALLFRAIDTLKLFDTIYAMTQGGPGTASETINLYLYTLSFNYFRMGYASSMVIALLVLVLGITLLLIRARKLAEDRS